MNLNEELLHFLNTCPTAYHVVDYIRGRLKEKGFIPLSEHDAWNLEPGNNYVVTRSDSALIAFRLPERKLTGFMIGASHADSPALKIKPNPEMEQDGLVRLNVEGYGGLIRSPWLDRPLSIAGRVCVREKNGIHTRLLHVDRDVCIIPSLAIHMDRSVNTEGHAFSVQKELQPVFRTADDPTTFQAMLANELGVKESDILAHDLFLCPHMPATLVGADKSFVSSPHLDDLQCTFANMKGFLEAKTPKSVPVLAIFDNEEVGSSSLQGANGTFLEDTLDRIRECLKMSDNAFLACCANSFMLSMDNSHAAHPNYPEKADLTNRPRLNGGIVIKQAAPMTYLTDARSSALVQQLCEKTKVPFQFYTNHSDIRGGSTLAHYFCEHLSVLTADIGLAQLAMHSPFETAGAQDTAYMKTLTAAFYGAALKRTGDDLFSIQL